MREGRRRGEDFPSLSHHMSHLLTLNKMTRSARLFLEVITHNKRYYVKKKHVLIIYPYLRVCVCVGVRVSERMGDRFY